MDLSTMIVDILRRKKEEEALNRGGPVAGAKPGAPMLQYGVAPKHDGRTVDDIVARFERG